MDRREREARYADSDVSAEVSIEGDIDDLNPLGVLVRPCHQDSVLYCSLRSR